MVFIVLGALAASAESKTAVSTFIKSVLCRSIERSEYGNLMLQESKNVPKFLTCREKAHVQRSSKTVDLYRVSTPTKSGFLRCDVETYYSGTAKTPSAKVLTCNQLVRSNFEN